MDPLSKNDTYPGPTLLSMITSPELYIKTVINQWKMGHWLGVCLFRMFSLLEIAALNVRDGKGGKVRRDAFVSILATITITEKGFKHCSTYPYS